MADTVQCKLPAPGVVAGRGQRGITNQFPTEPLPDEDSGTCHEDGGKTIGGRADAGEEAEVVGDGDPRPKQAEDRGHANPGPAARSQRQRDRSQCDCDEKQLGRSHRLVVVAEHTEELFEREWNFHGFSASATGAVAVCAMRQINRIVYAQLLF